MLYAGRAISFDKNICKLAKDSGSLVFLCTRIPIPQEAFYPQGAPAEDIVLSKSDEVLPSTKIIIDAWSGTITITTTMMTMALIIRGTYFIRDQLSEHLVQQVHVSLRDLPKTLGPSGWQNLAAFRQGQKWP